MAIGERIRFFRNLRGMTQQQLGILLGFSELTAHVRIAQYEANEKKPREKTLNAIADVLQVDPQALLSPNIDTNDGIMHTLFLLEDTCAFCVDEINGEICIRLDKNNPEYMNMFRFLYKWFDEASRYRRNECTREEYDQWRYRYPLSDADRFEKILLDSYKKRKKTFKCKQWTKKGSFVKGNNYSGVIFTETNPICKDGSYVKEGLMVIDDNGEKIIFSENEIDLFFTEL